jgi:CRISPR-associated protein Cas1
MHTLAITEQGTAIHAEGELLSLTKEGRVLRRVRLGEIDEIQIFGRVELSSGAIALLARREVEVIYLTQRGSFRARLAGRGTRSAQLRLAQLRQALDPAFCVRVSRAMVAGKVSHQRQLLLRAQRRLADPELAEVLGSLRLLAEQCPAESDLERLRGLEGRAAALYFGQLHKLVLAPEMPFAGRSRRPPRDPVNACLSFGYALLGTVVETEVLRCGLEPLVGFFHQPHHGRPSLALDLLEEFRPFIDTLVLRLVNRRQLGPLDFERHGGAELDEILAETPSEMEGEGPAAPPSATASQESGEGVYLGDTGRRVFLAEFYQRLRERLYYPPRQGSFELRDIIREQAYQLARVIEEQQDAYVAFVPG